MNPTPCSPTTPSPFRWRRSSYSDGSGGNCVEIAVLDSTIAVRDSKVPDQAQLLIPHSQFTALITALTRH